MLNWRKPEAQLELGSEVVELLIPHRRPFLLVDQILGFVSEPTVALRAQRHISANEPIFDGHFPDLHLWPGVYTIEGLGQTCNLLYVLVALRQHWEAAGRDPDDVLDALKNLHLGYRLHPGFDEAKSDGLLDEMDGNAAFISFSAAVNIKLKKPVFAGQTIIYESAVEHVVGDMARFRVEATVDGQVVATGTMTSHRGPSSVATPPDVHGGG